MGRALERDVNVIYLLENTATGKKYVGKSGLSGEQRFWRHRNNAIVRNLSGKLYNSMRKHGVDKFTVRELATASSEFVNMLEAHYILIFNTQKPSHGYNLTSGGDGGNLREGKKNSEAQKIAASNANRGRKWTPEQREVLMAARKKQADERRGQKRPEITGANSVLFGKKRTPETIAKIIATKIAKGLITPKKDTSCLKSKAA